MTVLLIGAVLTILAVLRVPVALAMFVAGIAGSLWIGGSRSGQLIATTVTGSLSTYILAAMIFALLLTGLARASGLSRHTFIGLRAVGRPSSGGGLVLAMLSLIIGASAGDSLNRGTAVAVRDRLEVAGYHRLAILGVLIGAAGLRFVVPVSVMIVWAGFMAEQSINKLMLAMAVTAIPLALILLIVAGLSEPFRKRPADMQTPAADRRSIGYAAAAVFLSLLLIVLVSGLVAAGLVTPMEVLGLAAIIVLIYAVIVAATGGARFPELFQGFVFSARKFGEIALFLIAISLIARAVGLSGEVETLVTSAKGNPLLVTTALLFILMIVSALLGALPAVGLVLIFIYPVMSGSGFDGTMTIVLVLATATLGQALPGVGRTSLFIRQCFDDATLGQLTRAALPYFIATVIWLAILVAGLPAILTLTASFR